GIGEGKAVIYAGFWKRAVALLIDFVILALIGALVNLLLAEWLASLIGLFLGWAYYAGMESSARQATIGKSAMGIYVADMNGQRISFMRATGRYFAKILSALILLI